MDAGLLCATGNDNVAPSTGGDAQGAHLQRAVAMRRDCSRAVVLRVSDAEDGRCAPSSSPEHASSNCCRAWDDGVVENGCCIELGTDPEEPVGRCAPSTAPCARNLNCERASLCPPSDCRVGGGSGTFGVLTGLCDAVCLGGVGAQCVECSSAQPRGGIAWAGGAAKCCAFLSGLRSQRSTGRRCACARSDGTTRCGGALYVSECRVSTAFGAWVAID